MQQSHTVVRALNARARAQAAQHDVGAEYRESARALNALQPRQERDLADIVPPASTCSLEHYAGEASAIG
eukprot:13893487-Alexandrium_andersonii.AAC.1